MYILEDQLFRDPKKIFFHSEDELNHYQSKMLRRLLRRTGRNKELPITYGPGYGLDLPSIRINTSGTTSRYIKERYFPKYLFACIQQYHTERTIVFNNWNFGPIVVLRQKRSTDQIQNILDGPHQTVVYGPRCPVWYLNYNTFLYTDDFWRMAIREVQRIRPVYLYGRPNEIFMLSMGLRGQQYDFPVVCAGETLHKHVRKAVLSVFSAVVDEMRCWDGGLTFFECKYGRKHILDELCYVKKLNDQLLVTDLLNCVETYINYCNYDNGDFGIGQCECGIFGKYFNFFRGKQIENLMSANGSLVSGSTIIQTLAVILKDMPDMPWRLYQTVDGAVTLFLGDKITPSVQQELYQTLHRIINNFPSCMYPVTLVYQKFEPSNAKQLLVVSDLVRVETYANLIPI